MNIGILGAGQLARMMIPPAMELGLELSFLEPGAGEGVRGWTDRFTQADWSELSVVERWAEDLSAITIEIEQVPADTLQHLEALGKVVAPSSKVLRLIQDKGLQKQWLLDQGFPTPRFVLVEDQAAVEQQFSAENWPQGAVQKVRVGGYDGRGVKVLTLGKKDFLAGKSLLEEKVSIKKELAVVVARSVNGEIQSYPTVEMVFDPVLNLVNQVQSPAEISAENLEYSQKLAQQIAQQLEVVGVLAVELFLDQQDQLWVNELAPRVHNSGHLTIEGSVTSQFANHLRSVAGLPLGGTQTKPSMMINLIGDSSGAAVLPSACQRAAVLATPEAHWHWYGKSIKPGRKVGHLTLTGDSLSVVQERTQKLLKG